MGIVTLRFETYEKYLSWLKKGSDSNRAEFIADHEKEHFDEALRRGYTPVYASQVFSSDGWTPICHALDFVDKEPTKEDLIAICLAPKVPSKGDLDLVEDLRKAS